MAVVTSHIATTIRGSVGGITYYRHGRTPICAKARPIGSHRLTIYRQAQQDAFARAASLWRRLSDDYRIQWNNLMIGMKGQGPSDLSLSEAFDTYMHATSLAFGLWDLGKVSEAPTGQPPEFPGLDPVDIFPPVPLDVAGTGFAIPYDVGTFYDIVIHATISYPIHHTRHWRSMGNDHSRTQCLHLGEGDFGKIRWTDLKPGMRYEIVLYSLAWQNPYSFGQSYKFLADTNTVAP